MGGGGGSDMAAGGAGQGSGPSFTDNLLSGAGTGLQSFGQSVASSAPSSSAQPFQPTPITGPPQNQFPVIPVQQQPDQFELMMEELYQRAKARAFAQSQTGMM